MPNILGKIEYLKAISCKIFTREGGEWLDGEILARRRKEDQVHYYVHLRRHNRRLDKWMSGEVIVPFEKRQNSKSNPKREKHQNEAPNNQPENKKMSSIDDDSIAKSLEDLCVPVYEMNVGVRNIEMIELGQHRIAPWYFSPFPEEFSILPCVYLCEFCLKYVKSATCLKNHLKFCPLQYPPGNEVYRKDSLSIFQVDGRKMKNYAENLCLLARLFLDHKLMDFNVTLFNFYVFTEVDNYGCHMVGYFSKQRESMENYNLSCILVLPPYQNKGYSSLMIQFSYELSKMEGKRGSPEKPLSDLGLMSYRSYWRRTISEVLVEISDKTFKNRPLISLENLCNMTAMTLEDVVCTLELLKALRRKRSEYIIVVTKEMEKNVARWKEKKKMLRIDPSLIKLQSDHYTNQSMSNSEGSTLDNVQNVS